MTTEELLRRISSRELTERMEMEAIEPTGERRMDMRFAMLASVVANAMGKPAKSSGKTSFSTADFTVDWDAEWDTIRERYEALAQQRWEEEQAARQRPRRPRQQQQGMSPDQILSAVSLFTVAIGGKAYDQGAKGAHGDAGDPPGAVRG